MCGSFAFALLTSFPRVCLSMQVRLAVVAEEPDLIDKCITECIMAGTRILRRLLGFSLTPRVTYRWPCSAGLIERLIKQLRAQAAEVNDRLALKASTLVFFSPVLAAHLIPACDSARDL